jgi:hypothetical protein
MNHSNASAIPAIEGGPSSATAKKTWQAPSVSKLGTDATMSGNGSRTEFNGSENCHAYVEAKHTTFCPS